MEALVKLLADGEFHAGDDLGERLGVSRAAVWKQVQKLQQMGLDIQSVKGKGYRLAQALELLDADSIRAQMPAEARRLLNRLDIHPQVTSTNDLAMAQATAGGSGAVFIAEQQTAGRGRRGRTWVSPFGCNLYLSCVWEFYQGAAALEGLSLATGVAVVRALEALGVEGAGLKWPNDVLLNDAKVAGILLEMTGDPSGRCQVVLGVGVNHRMPTNAANDIDQAWTRVDDVCPGVSRNALAAAVLSQLLLMLDKFRDVGFAAFHATWEGLDRFRGREVVIKTGAEDIPGIAAGVDRTGGLRLQTPSGELIMKGGELSLRLSR